ncbi:MAG TPA: ankyrin repeat domain-containing protein, partial [Parachlamydiaceae bacterium]|nr:ankyrin repeat domain-containing protein [Parachlamydiaceae bacterium]
MINTTFNNQFSNLQQDNSTQPNTTPKSAKAPDNSLRVPSVWYKKIKDHVNTVCTRVFENLNLRSKGIQPHKNSQTLPTPSPTFKATQKVTHSNEQSAEEISTISKVVLSGDLQNDVPSLQANAVSSKNPLIENALEQKDFKLLSNLGKQGLQIPVDRLVCPSFVNSMELAIQNNQIDDIKDFLSTIDINIQNKDGETLLQHAVHADLRDFFKVLVAWPNIDLNRKNNNGFTAWMMAVGMGHIDLALTLNDLKVDPNMKDSNGYTFLMKATIIGELEIVKKLLVYPLIDPNLQDNNGNTALMLAQVLKKWEIVKILMTHPLIDLNVKDTGGRNLLMQSMLWGNSEIIKAIIAHPSTNPNITEDNGLTALTFAITRGNTEIVEILLEHPLINPNIKSSIGQTALFLAVQM